MKYLILGAGPAGLSFANRLLQLGETDFLVLEKEFEAGGLCRSADVDGAPLDIGGGHFLDVRRPDVTKFLFHFMPEEEWNRYERDSRIMVNGKEISHPIEANIWQMEIEEQVKYLKSIATAGCNMGTDMPSEFVDWIFWKLGDKIANDYMIPYNKKMFGEELDKLGTYWLDKLPNVSFEETLLSCLTKRAYGQQPGHAQFFYPKAFGYGEVWRRMANNIETHIEYYKVVKRIDFNKRSVRTADGEIYQADKIITTIPWIEFEELVGMPDNIVNMVKELKYSSVQIEYFPENMDTQAHWIYYPNAELPYHRILVRHNFCTNSSGYWTETNGKRVYLNVSNDNFKYMNQYAYPLNTINKPEIMKILLGWSETQGVYGLGRWGEHQHYNSDLVVELALKMAERIVDSYV